MTSLLSRDRSDSKLISVLSRAVEELSLDLASPEEPTRSRLDKCCAVCSNRLSPNEGLTVTRARSDYSAACDLFQSRSPSPPQNLSKDARPHGLRIGSTCSGSAALRHLQYWLNPRSLLKCGAQATFMSCKLA